jgi:hypothetical protein
MAEPPRRFPPPWRVDKIPGGYIVRDNNGQALACVYSRENEAEAHRHQFCSPIELFIPPLPS